jgi:hypothetical protein
LLGTGWLLVKVTVIESSSPAKKNGSDGCTATWTDIWAAAA